MLPELNGILFCYQTRSEMLEVYDRLIKLKLTGITLQKAYNQQGVKYPWTIGIICLDKTKLDEVDKYLVDNKFDAGDADVYSGGVRVQQFLLGMILLGKYEPGFVKIKEGYCPINAVSTMACTFCQFGHATECHHPMSCSEAKCSHLEKYDENEIYRDEQ